MEKLTIAERRVLLGRGLLQSIKSIGFYAGEGCTKEEEKELKDLYDKMMYDAVNAVCTHLCDEEVKHTKELLEDKKPCAHLNTYVAVRHESGVKIVKCSDCNEIIN